MLFWIGILLAIIAGYISLRRGFYEMWGITFNLIISLYITIFAGPMFAKYVPAASSTTYGNLFFIAACAIGCFLVLHGISYLLITSQLHISFPKIFDVLGAGGLGILVGFLVWNFVWLLIYATPISENALVRDIGFDSQFQQNNKTVIVQVCEPLNNLVSFSETQISTEDAIERLLDFVKPRYLKSHKIGPSDPNLLKPDDLSGVNDTNTPIPIQDPPELDDLTEDSDTVD